MPIVLGQCRLGEGFFAGIHPQIEHSAHRFQLFVRRAMRLQALFEATHAFDLNGLHFLTVALHHCQVDIACFQPFLPASLVFTRKTQPRRIE